MPLVRLSELREMDRKSLEDKLLELKRELFRVRVQKAVSGQLDNPSVERELRKSIARVLTVMRERGYIKPRGRLR
uniref:Large ribosomal subunit protein uL29 n=1 Tax=uncultured korarchaeote TaxID=161241 RepID=A0A1L2JTB2_9CREN|nr:ribosomal protein L29 [uncultured korarchaeote]